MEQETQGTVVNVAKQWWLKVNTKAVRMGPLDGATFPHIIKVTYSVAGCEYSKRKWINAGQAVPPVGSTVKVLYDADKPDKARIVL